MNSAYTQKDPARPTVFPGRAGNPAGAASISLRE